jgi:hypothetical protein
LCCGALTLIEHYQLKVVCLHSTEKICCIGLADLLDPAGLKLKVSYNKLLTNAYSFALAMKDGNGKSATQKWFDLIDGMLFYMDKGDKITFSSDEELTAFLLKSIEAPIIFPKSQLIPPLCS